MGYGRSKSFCNHDSQGVEKTWDLLWGHCPRRQAGRSQTPRKGTKRGQTMSRFLKLIKNQDGATAIEYGLIAALIAVAAIGAMQGIGNKLNTTFNNVSNRLG